MSIGLLSLIFSFVSAASVHQESKTVDPATLGPNSALIDSYSWVQGFDLDGARAMLEARPDSSDDLHLFECGGPAQTKTYEVCNYGGVWSGWDGHLVFSIQASPIDIESVANWQPIFKANFVDQSFTLERFYFVSFAGSRYFSVKLPHFANLNLKDCNAGECLIEFSPPDSSVRLCSPRLLFTSRFCGGTLNVGNAVGGEAKAKGAEGSEGLDAVHELPAEKQSSKSTTEKQGSCQFSSKLDDSSSQTNLVFLLLFVLSSLLCLLRQRRIKRT